MGARDREAYINLTASRWARRQRLAGADERGRALNPTIGQRILLELAFSADADSVSLMGQASLADACQCSKRTVVVWLRALEADGIIAREKRGRLGTNGKGGGRTSDRIALAVGQSAPGAVSPPTVKLRPAHVTGQSAPGASQSAPGAPFLIQINNTPLIPHDKPTDRKVRDYAALGISQAVAKAVSCTRCGSEAGKACTGAGGAERTQLHVERYQAAATMAASQTRRRDTAERAEAEAPMRRVHREFAPDLWAACCSATGHPPTLTGKGDDWPFEADLVDRMAAALAGQEASAP